MTILEREHQLTEAERIRDVLREAKGLVVKGWFSLLHPDRRVGDVTRERHCVLSALRTAGASRAAYLAVATQAGVEIEVEFPSESWNLANWNDTHTHAEVIALFDSAIQAVAEEGR